MKKYVNYLVVLSFFMVFPVASYAAISFTNGKWETTFDCAEGQSQDDPSLNCNGMVWWGDWSYNSKRTTITSVANNPLGSGRGAQFWKGSGGDHRITGTIRVAFPSPQKEIWVRWYEKYESGFRWNLASEETKELYFHDGNGRSDPYIGFAYGAFETYTGINGAPTSAFPRSETSGWDDLFRTTNGVADGTWHCLETYMKMDTNGTNGVGRLWVDGVLVASKTNVNWSSNTGKPNAGWTEFDFLENQKDPGMSRDYYVHVDDIVIYNTTPPGRDALGNPFIGQIGLGGGTTGSAPPPSAPPPSIDMPTKGVQLVSESFNDNSWAGRGWYDGTDSTGVVPGGYSGNALRWSWSNSATQPDGFSIIRREFPATDEFLIEYYVKHENGWRGSGVKYHPHLIHIFSTNDSAYQSPGRAHSGLYFESLANTSTPYTNYPQFAHQDYQRTNANLGQPALDLTSSTELRSANHCNTPYTLTGATSGDCFNDGAGWYSANIWKSSNITIPANQWVKVTGYVKKNSFTGGKANFDGIIRLWVDGQLAIEGTKVLYTAGAYANTQWNKIFLAPYIGDGSPIGQTMWLDELSIWTVTDGGGSGMPPPPVLKLIR